MNIIDIAKLKKEDLTRLRKIIRVMSNYGFGEIFKRLPFPSRIVLPKAQKEKLSYSPPKRLRMVLEELGTTFIKIGQFASTRPDILPSDYIKELSKLQDDVKPVDFKQIKQILIQEWGEDWEDFFITFGEKPVASASISQVYKARLSEGDQVAVKVRRPKIGKEIRSDLKTIKFLAEFIEKHYPKIKNFQPLRIVEEFSRNLRRELDFKREAILIRKFKYNHRDIPEVVIPGIINELSTEKILVMEYIEGTPLNKSKLTGYESRKIAQLGVEVLARQILKDGLFHADPHPGNLFYTEDRKLSYLDFGMIGRLSLTMRNQLIDLLIALRSGEAELILQQVLIIGEYEGEIDSNTLIREIMEIMDRYIGVPIKEISIGKALFDIFDLIRRQRVLIHPIYTVVGKSILTSESTARYLDDEIDIIEVLSPHLKKFLLEKYKPENLWLNLRLKGKDIYRLLSELPSNIRQIVNKLKSGQLEIEFKHEGLENLIHTIDRTSNRISFSLIIAALIVGSSLVIQIEKGPTLMGISIFGLVGYLFASILGFWLLWSIIRSGRL
ncbi:MAG: ABC1 kinase family protein [Elusimicrobiota bacterium]